ncbi:tRNA1(Val) (adenine(37)-N6)-methyltransferase [Pedobacter sp. ASV28]|uniref:tRNA1(Val) (adenine(37)-N6)-methyltransferase n=1 Tax=Pedobacter sp. ASV28 TaxID=2795123 RepID=UPI0018ED56BA|nr:methyltransferase [Pedobacter sp. ASV28]
MNNPFRFKQFEVDQSGCAMKINTDGVLLGAIAQHLNPHRILDIGTGTGVIALMLAQRFPKAEVHAVEIDEQASATAGKNFRRSDFGTRLFNNNTAIEQFSDSDKFDLIVSNPPYFVNDFKSAEYKKGIARHTNEVFFDNLIKKVEELLSKEGRFWFILPVKQALLLIERAKDYGLLVNVRIDLHSDRSKPAFRLMVGLSRMTLEPQCQHFYIYEAEKNYTQAYKTLLKDFFLAF